MSGWNRYRQAILIGGAFNGVLSALPGISAANTCCCLWVVGGGAITAWVMQQTRSDAIDLADGAIGGLLAGITGAFVFAVVAAPVQYVLQHVLEASWFFHPNSIDFGNDVPPELAEFIEHASSSIVLHVGFGFVAMLFAGAVFSTLGGLLGALFVRGNRPGPGSAAGPGPAAGPHMAGSSASAEAPPTPPRSE